MGTATVGLIAPGMMGSAVGGAAVAAGTTVLWASEGRSAATRERAQADGLVDAGDLQALVQRADVVLSVCPPHFAEGVAREVSGLGFDGIYVDANAMSPPTALEIRDIVEPRARFVDGGITGGPPRRADNTTRLYLAGRDAPSVKALFDGGPLEAVVLREDVPAASALKITYAAWGKARHALLLGVRALARAQGIEEDFLAEWEHSRPGLREESERVAASVSPRAWRWAGELDEIAEAFEANGLPGGFHAAGAELYRRLADRKDMKGVTIDDALADILGEREA